MIDPNVKLHVAPYRRYLDPSSNALVVIGDYPEVEQSRAAYESRYGIAPTEHPRLVSRLMAACALAAASLADRESWGWTLSLPGHDVGLFCGVEPEGMICGRARPAERDTAIVYVQRQKGSAPMTQSHFEPRGTDPKDAVERYFAVSQQTPTRIALDDAGSGVLVQRLPDGDISHLAEMDDNAVIARYRDMEAEESLKRLGEFLVFYECRCNDAMIFDMFATLPEDQRAALWEDRDEVELECPRCARIYRVRRTDVQVH